MPDNLLPWNPLRPYRDRPDAERDFWNAGCPLGYFAQIVPKGAEDGTEYGNPISQVRCRLIETTTPETMIAEAGEENAFENLSHFNAALALERPGLDWPLLLLGGIGLLVLWRMGRR